MFTQLLNWVETECAIEIYKRTEFSPLSRLKEQLTEILFSEILWCTILGLPNNSKHFRIVRLLLVSMTTFGFHFRIVKIVRFANVFSIEFKCVLKFIIRSIFSLGMSFPGEFYSQIIGWKSWALNCHNYC